MRAKECGDAGRSHSSRWAWTVTLVLALMGLVASTASPAFAQDAAPTASAVAPCVPKKKEAPKPEEPKALLAQFNDFMFGALFFDVTGGAFS